MFLKSPIPCRPFMQLAILCIFILVFGDVESANILGIFPLDVGSKSHFYFNAAIMKSLADAGHNVTVISPFSLVQRHPNITMIDYRNDTEPNRSAKMSTTQNPYGDLSERPIIELLMIANDVIIKQCNEYTMAPNIRELFSSSDTKFDAIFVQLTMSYECFLPPARQWGIPVIGTTSFRQLMSMDEAVGNPHPLVLLPYSFGALPKKMTFYERLQNVYRNFLGKVFDGFTIKPELQKFYRRFYPSFDATNIERVSLLFSNNHASFLSKPLSTRVIEIGGIHIAEPKPLPEHLENFISGWPDGVILVCMGTVTDDSVVDDKKQKIFMDTFAKLPQRVIWKFGNASLNVTNNILISKWIPQLDILAHRNVKAFITHCGISGMYEAIYTGKPMIFMPLFADQHSNELLLRDYEVGEYVDFKTVTTKTLMNAISRVVNEKK